MEQSIAAILRAITPTAAMVEATVAHCPRAVFVVQACELVQPEQGLTAVYVQAVNTKRSATGSVTLTESYLRFEPEAEHGGMEAVQLHMPTLRDVQFSQPM
jgi:hypothetical protein